jgi:hypothetical protein
MSVLAVTWHVVARRCSYPGCLLLSVAHLEYSPFLPPEAAFAIIIIKYTNCSYYEATLCSFVLFPPFSCIVPYLLCILLEHRLPTSSKAQGF